MSAERVSLVYAHPWLYQAIMRALYGRWFSGRYRALAELLPQGSEVFEACAGDAFLYQRFLRAKGIRYQAGDLNQRFVKHGRQRGIPFIRHDLLNDPIPRADHVVLQASLYQFIPDERRVIEKLLAAARQTVIIAEPVRNLSNTNSRLIRLIAQKSANPGDGHKLARFDESSLAALFRDHFADRLIDSRPAPGGREMIYRLRGAG